MIDSGFVHEFSNSKRKREDFTFVPALLGNVLLYLGFLAGKSTRHYSEFDSSGGFSTGTEGVRTWAIVVALCALFVSAGLVYLKRMSDRDQFTYSLLIIPFGIAIVAAGMHWVDLLHEQSRENDYELRIAVGMPLAVVGGVVGMIPGIWNTFGFIRSRVSS